MWRTMGHEDAASRVSFDSKSRVVLPVDPRCWIGQPNGVELSRPASHG